MISIALVTYNHEQFIKDALIGIFNQRTESLIQLVICDDCSTDQTASIIKEFLDNNSNDKISVDFHFNNENLGMNKNFLKALSLCEGKYIALCEGDDYWVESNKLQKQLYFLENNLDYVLCFHNIRMLKGSDFTKEFIRYPPKNDLNINDLANGNFIYTVSCMYRNGIIGQFPDWLYDAPILDYLLFMLIARHGKLKYFNDELAVYRYQSPNSWTSKTQFERQKSWVSIYFYLWREFKNEDFGIDFYNKYNNLFSEIIKHKEISGDLYVGRYLEKMALRHGELFFESLSKNNKALLITSRKVRKKSSIYFRLRIRLLKIFKNVLIGRRSD